MIKKQEQEQQYQLKLNSLRKALAEGETSGPAEPFCFDAFMIEFEQESSECHRFERALKGE